jgi:uncharacterized protein YicC (UPF0701 family)
MSTTETDELVKRLRKRAELNAAARGHPVNDDPDVLAADRLVSLQGEVERRVLAEREACIEIARNWTTSGNAIATNIVHELEGRGAQVERLSQPSPAGWQQERERLIEALRDIAALSETHHSFTAARIASEALAAAPSAPPRASHPGDRIGDDKSEYGHEG